MHWQLILEEFGNNIQHIAGVDNIVSDTLSTFPYTPVDKYETKTVMAQCCVNELFKKIGEEEKNVLIHTKYLICAKRTTKVFKKKIPNLANTFRIGDLVTPGKLSTKSR